MRHPAARKAIVLAAGLGMRLRPFTAATPKPLLPVWHEPMLSRVVEWLRERGVTEIAVNCHHLAQQVEQWCRANGCLASREETILGTGGVLNPLREWIGGDDFWLVNGDIVFENAPELALTDRDDEIGCALVTTEGPRTIELESDRGLVTCWHSPDPGWDGTWTYCGVALLKAKILDYVEPQGFSSIIDAYEKAMMQGAFVRGVSSDDMLWTDAGTVERYMELNGDDSDNAYASIPQVASMLDALGRQSASAVKFCGARGSDRAFFKVDGAYIIAYDDEKRKENARYASHAKWLAANGISVPRVLAEDPALKVLALEDAGGEDLLARSKRRGEDRLYDYVAVVEQLAKFNSLDASPLELEPAFDAALYKWERDLFREHCLGSRFLREMPQDVEAELEIVAKRLEAEPAALVHRDFQSTNIIYGESSFKLIDFQGMRKGPGIYDLASLLFDPYIDLREGERKALAALWAKRMGRDPDEVAAKLPFAAVERLIQALGAYGRLASVGKKEFEKHIPRALENLLAAADDAELDAVGALAEDLIAAEKNFHDNAHGHHSCDCGHSHGKEPDHECHCEHGHHHHHGDGK